MKNWLLFLLVTSCLTSGCETQTETWDVVYPDDETDESGGGMQMPPPPGSSGSKQESSPDDFDPCPIVTYVVELDGQQHVIELRVFCDPMQDVYKGCPAPESPGM